MLFKNYCVLLFMLCLASSLSAQTLQLDPAVRTGKLSNGFTYYIRKNTEPQKRVIMYLANRFGSMQETDDQQGLAHFMEHMSFNGTKHFPKNKLLDYLQKAGVRFGADINAYTGFEETVYQLPLPSDDTAILRNGLQIMRDWAGSATLEDEEIEKERGVILEEKRTRVGADQRLMDQYFPMQVNHSRFANRLPIGTEEVLKNFKPDVIKKFYRDWYRPNLQALIVVGDIDVDQIERQIKLMFKDHKNPPSAPKLIEYKIPLLGKNQFIAATDPEETSTNLQMVFKHPGTNLKTEAEYRIAVLRNLLNGIFSERIQDVAQDPNVPFTRAQVGLGNSLGGLDAFSVNVGTKPGRLEESVKTVWKIVEQMKKFGVTETELERQKVSYLNNIQRAYDARDKSHSNNFVNEYLQYFLKGIAAPGITKELELTKKILASTTVGELNKLMSSAIKETDRDITILAPDKEKSTLPDEVTVNKWLMEAGKSDISAFTDKVKQEDLLAKVPAAGKILSKSYNDSIGVTRLTLSNGAKVLVKTTDFASDEIVFTAFSEGGTSLYKDADFLSAANTSNVVAANGIGNFTQQELGKMLAGKTVSAMPYIGERSEGINGGSTPKDLETALQIVHLYFTAPRKDTTMFQNIINSSRAMFENRSADPGTVFGDSVNAILNNYHYRRSAPRADMLDSLNLDRMVEIYRERFADASDFTFVFVGNIDTARFFPLVEQYIASLPSADSKEKAKDLGIEVPSGRIRKTIYKGADDKANVRLYFTGDYQYSGSNNIQLSALGTVLQYRITERIRESEGGAYSPQAGVNYVKYPRNRYMFTIGFTCAPANVDKLIAAALEEINKLKTQGVDEDDVRKFVAEQERGMEPQLRSNQFWIQAISSSLQNNDNPNGVLNYKKRLAEVKNTTVQSAANKYLDEQNFITIVHMPEKKAE